MDRFREIEAFIAVVEAGSFVRAGESLRISKAAVSRSVLDLEQRLGIRLLHRTTRRLSLTDAGRAYFDRSKQLLADLNEADSAVGNERTRPIGLLKVNAPQSFGIAHLAPVWGSFIEKYPEVQLDVTLADRIVDLVDEGFDVAVRITRLQDSTLVSRRLTSTRLILCASPTYLERRGAPQAAAELAQHDTIAYTLSSQGQTWRLRGEHGEEDVAIRPRMFANNGDTCRAAAIAHQGIILQPDFIVGADLRAGRLVSVLPSLRADDLGIHAVYPSRKHLSLKVRVLVDFLAEYFAEPRW